MPQKTSRIRLSSTLCAAVMCTLLSSCGGGGGSGGGGGNAAGAGGPTTVASPVISTAALWSDPATWGGTKPGTGAAVIIPAGKQVVIDENTPALGDLTIEGELLFKPAVTAELSADVIRVQRGGALKAGSASAPFTGVATITLRSTDIAASATGMGTRGILIDSGGKLELFGKAPAVS